MFNNLAAKSVIKVATGYGLKSGSSTIDLGNQTFSVSDSCLDEIKKAVKEVKGAQPEKLDSLKGIGGTSSTITELRLKGKTSDVRSFIDEERSTDGSPATEAFFKGLGFATYESIDLNGRFGAHRMDLNLDLIKEYGFERTFDLVINNGTSEHIFDQRTFMKNAHQLTATGGMMLHILPSVGYLNHGFYNYHPGFFWDLASANGYEMLSMDLCDRNGVLLELLNPNEVNTVFGHYFNLLPESPSGNVLLSVLMRRTSDRTFASPVQNKYLSDIDNEAIRNTYSNQSIHKRPPKNGLFSINALPEFTKKRFRMKRKFKAGLLIYIRKLARWVLLR